MRLAVPCGERVRVEPERRRQVDRAHAGVRELAAELGGRTVRRRQEDQVELSEAIDLDRVEHLLAGKVREQLRHRRARLGVRSQHGDLEVGMSGREPSELDASVPGRADDADALGHVHLVLGELRACSILQNIASCCNSPCRPG
jgi:hypothetical protein